MFHTGLGQYLPLLLYGCLLLSCLLALFYQPVIGLCVLLPILPLQTVRERFAGYPLGSNLITLSVVCVILGALLRGYSLPKFRINAIIAATLVYLYVTLWLGTFTMAYPAPLWITEPRFAAFKDYAVLLLIYFAAAISIRSFRHLKFVIGFAIVGLLLVDRSAILETLSHTFSHFDEGKRNGAALGYAGVNGLAAYLSQFGLFALGLAHFSRRLLGKLFLYGVTALTVFPMLFAFSRGAYLAFIIGLLFLGILRNRTLLFGVLLFLLTWQVVVPAAVRERIKMTYDSDTKVLDESYGAVTLSHGTGQHIDVSAGDRVSVWKQAADTFYSHPLLGIGFWGFRMSEHISGLRDTHNWYVEVLVETGVVGFILFLFFLGGAWRIAWSAYRATDNPSLQGLGLGLILCLVSCAIANFFGDRWSYIEINGPLLILLGAAAAGVRLRARLKQPVNEKNELVDVRVHSTGQPDFPVLES